MSGDLNVTCLTCSICVENSEPWEITKINPRRRGGVWANIYIFGCKYPKSGSKEKNKTADT